MKDSTMKLKRLAAVFMNIYVLSPHHSLFDAFDIQSTYIQKHILHTAQGQDLTCKSKGIARAVNNLTYNVFAMCATSLPPCELMLNQMKVFALCFLML